MHGCDKEYVSKYKVSRNERTGRESQNCNLGSAAICLVIVPCADATEWSSGSGRGEGPSYVSKPRVYQTTQTDKRDDKVTIDLNTVNYLA